MPTHGATPDYKRRKQIAELRAKGLTYDAIAKRLGSRRRALPAQSKWKNRSRPAR